MPASSTSVLSSSTQEITKEPSKIAAQEIEQNWINVDFINNNRCNAKVIESHKKLFCKDDKNLVDVDNLNSDYSKLLLNFNSDIPETK
jgi:hypothetical protein